MGRTQAVPGWRSVLPVRMQTRSGLMVVVYPPVIDLLPTPRVATPAARAFTSTTLTFPVPAHVTTVFRMDHFFGWSFSRQTQISRQILYQVCGHVRKKKLRYPPPDQTRSYVRLVFLIIYNTADMSCPSIVATFFYHTPGPCNHNKSVVINVVVT